MADVVDGTELRQAQDDQDTSPTTARELRGWYSTGLAAEIFAICAVGSFAPVTLEQLARERGVLRSDHITPCIQPVSTRNHARHVATLITRALTARADEKAQCVVFPFGRETSTASFAMYTFSIGVFAQALVLISFSAVADYGSWRKRMLFAFAFSGSVATMAMLVVAPQIYLLASLLVIIGVVCLGSSFVLLNSFLPRLASNHPDVNVKQQDDHNEPAKPTSPSALSISTQISSKGVGIGYAAALSVQVLSIGLLILLKKAHFVSESIPLRIILFMVGLFWFSLSIPGALWLRNRPGPTLSLPQTWRKKLPLFLQYILFSWSSLFRTLRLVLRLRQTWIFLVAWFLLSDAIATVSGTAILFARTELHMGTISIALLSITATSSGILGAFLWPKLSRSFNLSQKQTIIACMILMEAIPLYGLLGFLPFIRKLGFFGLQQPWEIYPLGIIHGFVMGGLSSYCRSFYGELVPQGSEAAFYALYAITDKGSSAVGPTIVGVIIDKVGTIRPAFGFLAILIALPMPLMAMIDVQKGREEAMMLVQKDGRGRGREEVRLGGYGEGEGEAAEGLLHARTDRDRDRDGT